MMESRKPQILMKNLSVYLRRVVVASVLFFSNDLLSTETPECPNELSELDFLLDSETFPSIEAPTPVQTACFPTEGIIVALTPTSGPDQVPPLINAVAILSEDLYKHTTGPVTRRSLLDEPALIPDHFSNNYWTVTSDLFYNFSPRVFFTKNSAFIRDYLDLTNQNIVNEIANTEFITADIPGILGLFSTIKLQQHRAGLMFGFARQWDHFLISARIPLYYMLENFYLTDDEIDRIKNNPFFDTDDSLSNEENVKRFLLKHIVGDKLGVGDTRLSFLAHCINSPRKNLWFGLQITAPTAKVFKRGLLGGEFDPDALIPPFNLQNLFNLSPLCSITLPPGPAALSTAVLTQNITDFLVGALDRLSSILINAPLGDGKHWGFGPQLNFRYQWNDYFSAHTYSAFQGFTPHHETRFYLLSKEAQDLNRNWRDPDNLGQNVSALNLLTVTTLFPVGVRTTVKPGFTFQANQAFMYKTKHFDATFGFDYWYQGREKLKPLTPEVPCNLPLVVEKALRPAAQQGKLFASLSYYDTMMRNCIDWHVSLKTDATVFYKGIGQNYSIVIGFGLEF
jgi:hypothetical protein